MTLPLVSCLMPTYNRAPDHLWLIEEAVESFMRQDYEGPAELVILNDTPDQVLACSQRTSARADSLRAIRIYNWATRLPTLGEKRNVLCNLARGDLFCPWDDDDISLPWRISQGVYYLSGCSDPGHPSRYPGPHTGGFRLPADLHIKADYWKPPQVWFMPAGQPPIWKHNVGVRHHASIFTRTAWQRVGGYPLTSGDEDAGMDARLGGWRLPMFPDGIPPAEWSYIYRFGVAPHHISGKADPQGGHAGHYREIGQRPVAQGRFEIVPRWREDYVALTKSLAPPSDIAGAAGAAAGAAS